MLYIKGNEQINDSFKDITNERKRKRPTKVNKLS